jgi:glycine cleavage system regulatory protein
MQTHLVLTVIGPDRPGLVSVLSDTIAAGGGNWLDTRMASLAGQFAGMVLVAVATDKADALAESLRRLEAQGLRLVIAKSSADDTPRSGPVVALDLMAHDRPGIVRDVSALLAAQQVSITEFETELTSGSFSGEAMFKAHAVLQLPESSSLEALRKSLEGLANELMVDLSVQDAGS